MAFWTYILRCADGSYYTGHTDNLDARFGSHQYVTYEGYTATRRPVTLAWSQDFATRIEALDAERRIKGWSRAKKQALIASDWQALIRLARNRQAESSPSTGSGQTVEGALTPPPHSVRAEPVEARLSARATPKDDGPTLTNPVWAEPVEARLSAHATPRNDGTTLTNPVGAEPVKAHLSTSTRTSDTP